MPTSTHDTREEHDVEASTNTQTPTIQWKLEGIVIDSEPARRHALLTEAAMRSIEQDRHALLTALRESGLDGERQLALYGLAMTCIYGTISTASRAAEALRHLEATPRGEDGRQVDDARGDACERKLAMVFGLAHALDPEPTGTQRLVFNAQEMTALQRENTCLVLQMDDEVAAARE